MACNATITGRNQNNDVGPPPITMVGDDPHLNFCMLAGKQYVQISIRPFASEQALLPLCARPEASGPPLGVPYPQLARADQQRLAAE